jgi:signal peptidase II
MLRLWWISAVVLVADQVTKRIAESYLTKNPVFDILPVFNFQLAYNTGAAFGLLSDAGGWQKLLLSTIALVVSVVIVVMVRRLKAHELQLAVALLLILGGAIGNLIDRVMYGHVIDFIHIYYQSWHWPNFNIADSAITVGAILLVMDAVGLRPFGKEVSRDHQ